MNLFKFNFFSNISYIFTFGDLRAPVEQGLGADLVLVLPDVVEEAAERHQLRHEHHLRGHANAEQLEQVGVFHAGHDVGLVEELFGAVAGALPQHLDGHGHLDVLTGRDPHAFVNGAERAETHHAALSHLRLTNDAQLGQVGFDVGRTQRLVVLAVDAGQHPSHFHRVLLVHHLVLPVVDENAGAHQQQQQAHRDGDHDRCNAVARPTGNRRKHGN